MRRGKSLLGQTISLCCTRKPEILNDCALPDRSGLVDESCWDSYFGPFSGRAYMALEYSSSKVKTNIK